VIDREVNRALVEATAFQARAKWPEALDVAKRADGFLAVGASESLRRRVQELRNDLEMVLRLEEIRLNRPARGTAGGHVDNHEVDASYAQAFRDCGIDIETLEPSTAGERIRARAIRQELTVAMDHWAHVQRTARPSGDASWRKLIAVARAADPDEWRNQVRDAVKDNDSEALAKLAASERIRDLPVQTASLLGSVLPAKLGQSLLRRAQREHPDDFWINFELAYALDFASPPHKDLDEAIRFYTAALAVRPRSAPTHFFLGYALRHRGKLDEAILEYETACALRPDDVITQNNLAWILATCADVSLRDPRRAVEHASRAVELKPNRQAYWNTLGIARYRAGDCGGAIEALEKSLTLQGHHSFNWFFLAMARWRRGERDEARRLYDLADRWMAKVMPKNEELRRFRAEAANLLQVEDHARSEPKTGPL
jgi:tetratricopeptide (TPR) repeat protein